MSKIAIIDGKLIQPQSEAVERTNILLAGGKIMGVGYIPDDDDGIQININNYHILPNITGIHPISEENQKKAVNFGITRWISSSSEHIITTKAGDDLFLLLEETKDTPIHVILKDVHTSLEITKNRANVTTSLPIELLDDTTIPLLKNGTITTICANKEHWDTFLETLFTTLDPHFNAQEILAFISTNILQIFDQKAPGISLLNTPNFCAFSLKQNPNLKLVVKDGEVIVQND